MMQVVRKRWRDLNLREASGGLGDLGTFLPLLLNMAAFGAVEFSPALFYAGVFNVVTGLMWDTPMPVQPMKTIAAVTISSGNQSAPGLSPNQVIGAGLSVSVVVLLLGVTGLIEVINWLVPQPVVRGLQVGLGTNLVRGGFALISSLPFCCVSADSGLLALLATLFVLLISSFGNKLWWLPSALILTAVGFIIASVQVAGSASTNFAFSIGNPFRFTYSSLTWSDIWSGFSKAGLAQLPLTTLNSVVSVVDLNNKSLFPLEKEKHVSRKSVASSVGLMNIFGLMFGAMPMCHGAGGLAAQYRFGARTGAALLVLGFSKIVIAILLGENANTLLAEFPSSILAVMQIFAGLGLFVAGLSRFGQLVEEHAKYRHDQLENTSSESVAFMLAGTAAVTVSAGTGWGFLAGMVVAVFSGGLNKALHKIRTHKVVREKFPSFATSRSGNNGINQPLQGQERRSESEGEDAGGREDHQHNRIPNSSSLPIATC